MSKEHIVRPDQPVCTENNLKQLYLSTGSTQSPKDVGDNVHIINWAILKFTSPS